jgi:hypothetical protein
LATFETQVEALTGISIDGSSNPTQTELSSFLVDGVRDVVNRMIEVRPAELSKFTKTTNATSFVAKIGKVLSVVREHDSTDILRKCTVMDPGDRYDATDSESLNYRSKTSPGFYELDGNIHCVPQAASGNNDIVVTQVHYDTGLVYGDTYGASTSSIVSFPSDYEYLVAIYAAIKSLHRKMGATIMSVTAVPPDVPTLAAQSVSITGTAPTYTQPKVSGATEELTNTITAGTIGTAGDKIDWTDWWDVLADYIEDQEDTELAGTQLQKISTYVATYAQAMQNQLNVFNDANIEYQATLQKNIKDADLLEANEVRKLQKYSAEVTEYTAAVNAEVQEKTAKMQHYQLLHAQLKVDYDSAFVTPGASE